MRGVKLEDLIRNLRAEIGHSTNTALGTNSRDALAQALRRTQDRLWEEYDWAHMKADRDIPLVAGTRYYSVPNDLPYERIIKVAVRDGTLWRQLGHGIGQDHYSHIDSDTNEQAWPVTRWDVAEDTALDPTDIGVIEVWPIPDQNGDENTMHGILRITGVRKMRPLIEESDKCDLDGTLLVLNVAAEMLARQNQADAQIKMQQAQQLLSRLFNQNSNKKKVFSFLCPGEPERHEPYGVPMMASARRMTESIMAAFTNAEDPIEAGLATGTLYIPYALNLSEVRIKLKVAQTSGDALRVDVLSDDVSILAAPAELPNGETELIIAGPSSTIVMSAIPTSAVITTNITQIGDGTAIGLTVALVGRQP
jgi:hypothetical protein